MNKKNIFITTVCLLAIGAAFLQAQIKVDLLSNLLSSSVASEIPIVSETDHRIVTKEDRAPLVIPPNIVQQGKIVKIPILMYHHIGSVPVLIAPHRDPIREDMTASPEDFEQQVKWLSAQGYTSITLQNILDFAANKFTLPKKPIIFTFDDGYEDVFQNAVPILERYNFVGSFAVITQWQGLVLGTNVYASWDTIVLAQQQGMEIVSHTQDHFDGKNPKFSSEAIYKNLIGSQNDLRQHLGSVSNVLIYPYGHYTPDYITQAKKAGFSEGITVHEGDLINLNNLMEVPRIRIHGHQDFERFKRLVNG